MHSIRGKPPLVAVADSLRFQIGRSNLREADDGNHPDGSDRADLALAETAFPL